MTYDIFPIGYAETPYKFLNECPSSAWLSDEISKIKIYDNFKLALKGIEKDQNLFLVWWMNLVGKNGRESLVGLDGKGVFSMRSPNRPNPIGLTRVCVKHVENNLLYVQGLECVSGSMILDIKGCIINSKGELL